MWRQGMYVLPFMARLGVAGSWSGWSATEASSTYPWTIEGLALGLGGLTVGCLWCDAYVFGGLATGPMRSSNRVVDSPNSTKLL